MLANAGVLMLLHLKIAAGYPYHLSNALYLYDHFNSSFLRNLFYGLNMSIYKLIMVFS